jgi:hypothetical protein
MEVIDLLAARDERMEVRVAGAHDPGGPVAVFSLMGMSLSVVGQWMGEAAGSDS